MICEKCEYEAPVDEFRYVWSKGPVEVRECPRCGTKFRCHRPEELVDEVSNDLKKAHELLEKGDYRGAKKYANIVAAKTSLQGIPGVDDDLRVLFKKIKVRRAEARDSLYVS